MIFYFLFELSIFKSYLNLYIFLVIVRFVYFYKTFEEIIVIFILFFSYLELRLEKISIYVRLPSLFCTLPWFLHSNVLISHRTVFLISVGVEHKLTVVYVRIIFQNLFVGRGTLNEPQNSTIIVKGKQNNVGFFICNSNTEIKHTVLKCERIKSYVDISRRM